MNALRDDLPPSYWVKCFHEINDFHVCFNIEPTPTKNVYRQTDGLKRINLNINLN